MRRRLGAALAIVLAAASWTSAGAQPTPKYGPQATSILLDNAYLRSAPAPDYWTLSAFYVPQRTSSDCSAAAATMVANALRGVPAAGEEPLITEPALIAATASPAWTAEVAEGGPGVRFHDFAAYLAASLKAAGVTDATVEAVEPPETAAALARLRADLAASEASASDVILVYFNQGVATGDWDGPHISPIGAYDAVTDRVLIMDVDREWYVPYWTPVPTLLAAMVKPIRDEFGPLAGGRGGYYIARRP